MGITDVALLALLRIKRYNIFDQILSHYEPGV